jgi:hypothetical protein
MRAFGVSPGGVATLALVACALVPACARPPRVDGATPPAADSATAVDTGAAASTDSSVDDSQPRQGASLEVENNSTLDVRIFVLRGSMSTRLGTVTGMTTAQFALKPEWITRELRLHAQPIGGWIRTSTDAIYIRPGQLVSWKLDNKLRSYRLSVY